MTTYYRSHIQHCLDLLYESAALIFERSSAFDTGDTGKMITPSPIGAFVRGGDIRKIDVKKGKVRKETRLKRESSFVLDAKVSGVAGLIGVYKIRTRWFEAGTKVDTSKLIDTAKRALFRFLRTGRGLKIIDHNVFEL